MKKILVLSDIHGRVDSLRQVLARNSDISLVFVAGDLTNFGGAEAALAVISELEAMECKPRIALVPGNCETLAARRAIESSGHSVDGRLSTMEFCRVAGAGGGLRRAGLTSFEKTESELKASLERALAGLSSSDEELPLFILTHNPPYGTNADRRAP